MDTCPNCGASLPAFLVEAMKDPNETWAVCPHDKDQLVEYEALPDAYTREEFEVAGRVALDWFYGRLWNEIFHDAPDLQMDIGPKPVTPEGLSWDDFGRTFDTYYPKDGTHNDPDSKMQGIRPTFMITDEAQNFDSNKENS